MTIITENSNPDTILSTAQEIGIRIHQESDLPLYTFVGFTGNMIFGMTKKWDFSFVYEEGDFLEAIENYEENMRKRTRFIKNKPLNLLPVTAPINQQYNNMDFIRYLYKHWGIPCYRIYEDDPITNDYLLTVDKSLSGGIYKGDEPKRGDSITNLDKFKLIFDYSGS